MLLALLLAPALSFHTFAVAAVVICACLVLFWLLRRTTIPEPFNYVVYCLLALIALYFLFWLLHQV